MTAAYQILGFPVPLMLGRSSILKSFDERLLKLTPDHVMVVGPRWYGKSVLLCHLANAYRENSGHYLTAVFIDLQHNTPNSNETFMQRFSEEIKTALEPCEPELSEYLGIDEGILAALKHVLDELASEGKRILVVLDSFDCVPFGTQVTRTLLDNLRSLAVLSSLTLVTGSRRLPREVCRTAAVDSSPFWNIFYPEPIRITALVESDWRLFLEPFRAAGHTLDASAEKEITNWTGGVPVLTCALLRKLLDQRPNRSLSGNDINEAEPLAKLREIWGLRLGA